LSFATEIRERAGRKLVVLAEIDACSFVVLLAAPDALHASRADAAAVALCVFMTTAMGCVLRSLTTESCAHS
jgi:hypothetical protein